MLDPPPRAFGVSVAVATIAGRARDGSHTSFYEGFKMELLPLLIILMRTLAGAAALCALLFALFCGARALRALRLGWGEVAVSSALACALSLAVSLGLAWLAA